MLKTNLTDHCGINQFLYLLIWALRIENWSAYIVRQLAESPIMYIHWELAEAGCVEG